MSSDDLFGSAREGVLSRVSSAETVYAHCDGGARGNPGPSGYGAVIATAEGKTLAELSEYLGNRTNNYAEYSGLLGVLAWALANGKSSVRVVSDSELMVKQIQGKYKVNSPDLRPLFEEAKRRIAKLDSFGISHALRHKNKDADRLANEAMDRGTGRSRAAEPLATLLAPHERNRASAPVRLEGASAGVRPAGALSDRASGARASAGSALGERAEVAGFGAGARSGEMLRGFVKDGAIHLLGGKTLPDGVFVKVVQE